MGTTQKDAGTRVWQALYQGAPSPATGTILEPTNYRTYNTPQTTPGPNGTQLLPNPGPDTQLIQSWDMTFKATNTSDYVVGQIWLRRGHNFYLIDQVRGRYNFTETVNQVRALTAKYPQAITKLIEDKANGPAVIDTLRSTTNGIIPVNPQGGKEARAHAIAPYHEAGNIHLPAPELAPWVSELTEETRAFPHGKHDDQIDAMTQAITYLAAKAQTNTGGVITLD